MVGERCRRHDSGIVVMVENLVFDGECLLRIFLYTNVFFAIIFFFVFTAVIVVVVTSAILVVASAIVFVVVTAVIVFVVVVTAAIVFVFIFVIGLFLRRGECYPFSLRLSTSRLTVTFALVAGQPVEVILFLELSVCRASVFLIILVFVVVLVAAFDPIILVFRVLLHPS